LTCKECGKEIDLQVPCGKRFPQQCPVCAKKWQRKTFKRYYKAVLAMKKPKFVTLTLWYDKTDVQFVAKDRDIWQMRKQLFRVLREEHHKPIGSWVATVEYPNHIHLVIDSEYIDQDLISREWQTITGDSFRVDIRAVNTSDIRQMASYLTKYITKANQWDEVNLDDLVGFHIKGSWNIPAGVPPPHICHYGQLAKRYLKIEKSEHTIKKPNPYLALYHSDDKTPIAPAVEV